MSVYFDVRHNRKWTFSLEEAWLCIEESHFSLKLKTSWWIYFLHTCSFSLHKMLTDGLEWCGLLVGYCDVLSAVWALILTAPIDSIGEQVMNANLYISPKLFRWRIKLICISNGLWVSKYSSFSFWSELILKITEFIHALNLIVGAQMFPNWI